jgi:hypothetical protein
MRSVKVDNIDLRRTVVPLNIRELDPTEVETATRLLEQNPEPMWNDDTCTSVAWDWVYAVAVLDLNDARRENPVFPYEIQTFRIGDLSLAGLMGEPFVEAQLDIKKAAPTRHTFVAHFCNGYAGYLPTRRAFAGGGYETRTGAGSKLPLDALEKVTEAAIELLRDLHKDSSGIRNGK